jgi:lysophospholipase L1-like esterase
MMGGDPESSYQYWLKQELMRIQPDVDYQLVNEGMCGDTSQGIVSRLTRSVKLKAYDLVILAGGTNDLGLTNAEQVFANLKHGYEICMHKNIPVIAPSLPPISLAGYGPHVTALNNKIKACAAHNHMIVFADWHKALQDDRGFLADMYNAGDGVHLSTAGYKCIGLLMAPLVKSSVKQLHTGIKGSYSEGQE